jgi:diacylglycerol O-acyltransferase
MYRLSGQDASFLYTETSTVLMHTLKVQIFESPYTVADYQQLHDRLEAALDVVPMLRRKVLFVPFNLHHPVMVDDPDFDLDFHIYRAALPAPGSKQELNEMISQIACHRLDRLRPLWELWMLSGLEDGRVAIVHKIHHCLADGSASLQYLSRVFSQQAVLESKLVEPWLPEPQPSGLRLVRDALVDHVKSDVRNFPAFVSALLRGTRRLLKFNRDVGSPTLDRLSHRPPRTLLNHALSARRTFTTRQISLAEVKALKSKLQGTVNDVVLALAAAAIRNYLKINNDLPEDPLCTAIPVSADPPGTVRERGNRVTYLPTCLWTNIADPLERFRAIQQSTRIGKEELGVLGQDTFVQLMQYMPPFISLWKAARKQRLRMADKVNYKPLTNVIVSNMAGPRERLSGNYGTLIDLYSMGPLVEGCGLNVTVWSYADHLNFSVMGCKKAVPDIDTLADGLIVAMSELQQVVADDHQ